MKWQLTRAPLGPSVTDEEDVDPDDRAPSAWLRLSEVAWHLPRVLSGLGPLGSRSRRSHATGAWSSTSSKR